MQSVWLVFAFMGTQATITRLRVRCRPFECDAEIWTDCMITWRGCWVSPTLKEPLFIQFVFRTQYNRDTIKQ